MITTTFWAPYAPAHVFGTDLPEQGLVSFADLDSNAIIFYGGVDFGLHGEYVVVILTSHLTLLHS